MSHASTVCLLNSLETYYLKNLRSSLLSLEECIDEALLLFDLLFLTTSLFFSFMKVTSIGVSSVDAIFSEFWLLVYYLIDFLFYFLSFDLLFWLTMSGS